MKKFIVKSLYFIVAMITLTVCLAGCGLKKEEEKDKKNVEFAEIRGGWQSSSEGGSYYVFEDDDTYYWYKSADDLNDNYYKGTMEVYHGQDALDDLGITLDRIDVLLRNSNGKVTEDNVYSMHLHPTYLISGGIDKTDTLTSQFDMKLLFIYIDENNAQAFNYTTGDTYYFIKKDR